MYKQERATRVVTPHPIPIMSSKNASLPIFINIGFDKFITIPLRIFAS